MVAVQAGTHTSQPTHHHNVYVHAGVTSILQHLGIISDTTRLAGSSGGAAVAAASCSGLQPRQQYEFLLQMADTCRPSGGCRGFLGSVVSQQLHSVLPPDALQACSGRLYTAVTAARPDGLPNHPVLLGSTWQNKEQLVSAVSASCYLPALSGPTATTKLHWKPEAGAVYDGGFSHRLPCPPGGCRVRGVDAGCECAWCGCGCLTSNSKPTLLRPDWVRALPERPFRRHTRLSIGQSKNTQAGPDCLRQACAMCHMLLLLRGCWCL